MVRRQDKAMKRKQIFDFLRRRQPGQTAFTLKSECETIEVADIKPSTVVPRTRTQAISATPTQNQNRHAPSSPLRPRFRLASDNLNLTQLLK